MDYIPINESTFLFYRLISRVHHVIDQDITQQVVSKHKNNYVQFFYRLY